MWLNGFYILLCTLFLLYAILILVYRKWFLQLRPFLMPEKFQPQIKFSVVIPARNEEENIGLCLQAIFQQTYPSSLFEVIVVDDHSTDNTGSIVRQLQQKHSNLQLISLSNELDGIILNAYKKKAIETAIGHAKGDWIMTTDADCFMGDEWMALYAGYIEKYDPVFIAAPVGLIDDGSVLSVFQTLDFMALQGITAASVSAGFHSMCNGANLAYRKDVFYEVNGFKGIDNIASGDDMLLMNKIRLQYPQRVMALFAQGAIVSTYPMPGWKSFFNQRIRWASKADQYADKTIFWVLLLVYLLNAMLFVMPFLSFFDCSVLWSWLLLLTAKTIVEASFALPIAAFFGIKLYWWSPVLQILHISYTVIAGWLGKFGRYEWKGRQVK